MATAQTDTKHCVVETPGFKEGLGTVGFATSKTWKVDNQEWSDAVTATKCQKETFFGMSSGKNNADCRTNPNYSGDLFSWCAVYLFQKQLCPAPWRVPTKDDFVALDKALRETTTVVKTVREASGYGFVEREITERISLKSQYANLWGLVYGGSCNLDGSLANQSLRESRALYWSSSEYCADNGFRLNISRHGEQWQTSPDDWNRKSIGVPLRCVRDN